MANGSVRYRLCLGMAGLLAARLLLMFLPGLGSLVGSGTRKDLVGQAGLVLLTGVLDLSK